MMFVSVNNDSGLIEQQMLGGDDAVAMDLAEATRGGPFPDGLQPNGFYYLRHELPNEKRTLYCAFDEVRVRKQAKYYAKLTAGLLESFAKFVQKEGDIYEKATEVAVHNTRNINAQMNAKLMNLLGEREMSKAHSKLDYVRERVSSNIDQSGRVMLHLVKSLSQVLAEYDVIDYLQPGAKLSRADFQRHRLHTVLVLAFYIYEVDFHEKSIRVWTPETRATVNVNFRTVKTAIGQLFENALKYCKPDSQITITVDESNKQTVWLHFDMVSAEIRDDELMHLCEPGFRGQAAGTLNTTGKGYGMYMIDRLAKLNNGSFRYERRNTVSYEVDGISYSNNRFSLELPKS